MDGLAALDHSYSESVHLDIQIRMYQYMHNNYTDIPIL